MPGVFGWLRRGREDAPASVAGVTRLSEVAPRSVVTFEGQVEKIGTRERPGTPWLEATVTDGTGSVVLVFMGRDAVGGVEVGRRLRVEGRIGDEEGRRVVYNPAYTLL